MAAIHVSRRQAPPSYEAYGRGRENLLGSAIFLGYIAAAVYFTLDVVGRIRRLYKSNTAARRDEVRKDMNTFIVLGTVSFLFTSVNMLSFLFLSFSNYHHHSKHPLAFDSATLDHVWEWVSHSTLFEDFVRAVVHQPQRWWWAQANTLGSMVFFVIIADRFKVQRIPGLSSLLALAQILPISLTLNLAILSQMTAAPPPPAVSSSSMFGADKPSASSSTSSVSSPVTPPSPAATHTTSWITAGLLQIATVLAYEAALDRLPELRKSPYFLPAVLAARCLLCIPFFLPPSDSITVYVSIIASALPWLIFTITRHQISPDQLLASLNHHPSTRTFGYDVVLCFLTLVIYILIQLREQADEETRDDIVPTSKKMQ